MDVLYKYVLSKHHKQVMTLSKSKTHYRHNSIPKYQIKQVNYKYHIKSILILSGFSYFSMYG